MIRRVKLLGLHVTIKDHYTIKNRLNFWNNTILCQNRILRISKKHNSSVINRNDLVFIELLPLRPGCISAIQLEKDVEFNGYS